MKTHRQLCPIRTCLYLLFVLYPAFAAVAATYSEGQEAYLAKDYPKALAILRPLAVQGNAKAQITMGVMYDFGHGVQKDPSKAISWYEKAAELGNSVVQHDLGVKYFKGIGTPKNDEKAAYWWKKAAENGVTESQYNLGILYSRGLGVEEDSTKAAGWYSKAASQGHPLAQYSLGVMYSFGQGVEQNYTRAVNYFTDASEQDISQAQYNLAVLLEHGRGTEIDITEAKKWYRKAAEQGLEQAAERLALLESGGKAPQSVSEDAIAESESLEAPIGDDTQSDKIPVKTQTSDTTTVAEAGLKESKAATATKTQAEDIVKSDPAPEKADDLAKKKADQVQKKQVEASIAVTTTSKLESKATPPATTDDLATLKKRQAIYDDFMSGSDNTKTDIPVAKTRQKAPVARTAPVAPSLSGSNLTLLKKGTEWINTQSPDRFTLQMIAFNQIDNAARYLRDLKLGENSAIYKSSMSGRTLYKVVYGNFASRSEALRARRDLPAKYRKTKPFPRKFGSLTSDMK